jgi:hypothetical protein
MKKIEYLNLPNCIRLTNGEVEIIVTTDVGPRIISYNFVGGENILGEHPNARVETALGEFKPYGGHRLWIAPENMPNSYAPDNAPIEYQFDEAQNSILLKFIFFVKHYLGLQVKFNTLGLTQLVEANNADSPNML